MPIRFRCVYCDKLLGIARRKAGSVVNCPQCHQPLIVPTPEPEPAPAAAAAPAVPDKLFERDDFDELLQEGATIRATDEPRRKKRSKVAHGPPPAPLPPQRFPVERSLPAPPLPAPAPAVAQAKPAGMVLSTGLLVLLIVVVVILTAVAFGAGIVVGRMIASPS